MSCSVGCCQWPGIVWYHNGLFLWPCGHSRLYVVAASCAVVEACLLSLPRAGMSGGRLDSVVLSGWL